MKMNLGDKSKEREEEGFQKRKLILDRELYEFSENFGLTQDMPHNARPFHFLKLFLTKEFFQKIVNAEKVFATSRPLRRQSILNLWVPVKKFIGVIYHMGLVSVPSYRHYWQKAAQYSDKFVQKSMLRNRFLANLRCFAFGQ